MRTIVLFFAVVIGVAAISALATRHFIEQPPKTQDAMHGWLHEQLGLSAAQKKSLEDIESRYAADEERLRSALAQANQDLATAIRQEGSYTPRVGAAIEHVHHQMGELQKLSIAHLFEMTTVLSPEQSAKLLQLAEMALTETP